MTIRCETGFGTGLPDRVFFLCWKVDMRYCPHCHRLNPGRPIICHFCGRTWYVRLCPRHHINPASAQYCGECGSMDLTETAGPRPWGIYSLKIMIVAVLCLVIFLLGRSFLLSLRGEALSLIMRYIVVLILLIGAYMIVLSALPSSIKKYFMSGNRYF